MSHAPSLISVRLPSNNRSETDRQTKQSALAHTLSTHLCKNQLSRYDQHRVSGVTFYSLFPILLPRVTQIVFLLRAHYSPALALPHSTTTSFPTSYTPPLRKGEALVAPLLSLNSLLNLRFPTPPTPSNQAHIHSTAKEEKSPLCSVCVVPTRKRQHAQEQLLPPSLSTRNDPRTQRVFRATNFSFCKRFSKRKCQIDRRSVQSFSSSTIDVLATTIEWGCRTTWREGKGGGV